MRCPYTMRPKLFCPPHKARIILLANVHNISVYKRFYWIAIRRMLHIRTKSKAIERVSLVVDDFSSTVKQVNEKMLCLSRRPARRPRAVHGWKEGLLLVGRCEHASFVIISLFKSSQKEYHIKNKFAHKQIALLAICEQGFLMTSLPWAT